MVYRAIVLGICQYQGVLLIRPVEGQRVTVLAADTEVGFVWIFSPA